MSPFLHCALFQKIVKVIETCHIVSKHRQIDRNMSRCLKTSRAEVNKAAPLLPRGADRSQIWQSNLGKCENFSVNIWKFLRIAVQLTITILFYCFKSSVKIYSGHKMMEYKLIQGLLNTWTGHSFREISRVPRNFKKIFLWNGL